MYQFFLLPQVWHYVSTSWNLTGKRGKENNNKVICVTLTPLDMLMPEALEKDFTLEDGSKKMRK